MQAANHQDLKTLLDVLSVRLRNSDPENVAISSRPGESSAQIHSIGYLDAKHYALSNEVTFLTRVLGSVTAELNDVGRARRRKANAFLPINRLPNETLGYIFEYLNIDSVRAVSATSQRWRNVALTTPSLWTAIEYVYSRTPFPLISMYMERSKQVKLQIWIRFPAEQECPGEDDVRDLIDFFTPAFARCSSLRVIIGRSRTAEWLLPIQPPLPFLQAMRVEVKHDQYIQTFTGSLQFDKIFHVTPPLLEYLYFVIPRGIVTSPVDSASLRYAIISNSKRNLIELLRDHPHLRILRTTISSATGGSMGHDSPRVIAPALRSLSVQGALHDLLHVEAPNLELLDIYLTSRDNIHFLYPRHDAMPRLRHLSFSALRFDSEALVAFLREVPQLSTLALFFTEGTIETLIALRRASMSQESDVQSAVLCPSLRTLWVHYFEEQENVQFIPLFVTTARLLLERRALGFQLGKCINLIFHIGHSPGVLQLFSTLWTTFPRNVWLHTHRGLPTIFPPISDLI